MSELELYTPPSIEALWRYANAYSISNMFPDIQSAEQAFVKISAGAELGLQPFQSMNGIDVIKGKPVVKPALLAGMLDNNDAYDYSIEWEDDACTVTIFKDGKKRGDSRFSMDDAAKAGLAGKDNWNKFERNMLLSRAMSNAVRWYAPGLTMGPVYVTGEIVNDAPPMASVPPMPTEAPDHATPKPRTRITAEVITDAEVIDFDPATEPPPSVAKPPGPLAEPLAAGPLPLRAQLTHMSAQQKADLWRFAGLERNTKMADVKARLIAYADELGMDFTEEPDAKAILDTARAAQPKGNAEAFEIFAKTGQDIEPGDQVEFDEVMT